MPLIAWLLFTRPYRPEFTGLLVSALATCSCTYPRSTLGSVAGQLERLAARRWKRAVGKHNDRKAKTDIGGSGAVRQCVDKRILRS